jgi:branched-chain amino acid transport system ATP-binding protein
MPGLELTDLAVDRGSFPIIRGVTMHVPDGEVTVLLGPNGAGKTTLLEAISGTIPASRGTIELHGTAITSAARTRRARLGLSHVEQGRTIFGELTVVENVAVSAVDADAAAEALQLFPELRPRHQVHASALSGGEQQMLVLARALAARPTMLLVDEMSLGLAPAIVHRLMPLFAELAGRGVGVLLVEQFADLALQIGTTAYVLSRGEIALQGPCSELRDRGDEVRRSYLGGTTSVLDS